MCIRDRHTTEFAQVGDHVGLKFGPDDLHIMRKMFEDTTNHLEGEVVREDTISFLGIEFMRKNLGLPVGTKLNLTINPRDITLVSEDHCDVVLYLETLIYKGAYNEMLFYSETDGSILVYSEYDEQVGTDLGLKFDFDKIVVTPLHEEVAQG